MCKGLNKAQHKTILWQFCLFSGDDCLLQNHSVATYIATVYPNWQANAVKDIHPTTNQLVKSLLHHSHFDKWLTLQCSWMSFLQQQHWHKSLPSSSPMAAPLVVPVYQMATHPPVPPPILQQIAQDCIQVGFDCFQRRRLHCPSGKPVPVLTLSLLSFPPPTPPTSHYSNYCLGHPET